MTIHIPILTIAHIIDERKAEPMLPAKRGKQRSQWVNGDNAPGTSGN